MKDKNESVKMKSCVAIMAFSALLVSCSMPDRGSREVSRIAESFLESLFTCRFAQADELCTSAGQAEVRWFASNLTEEELALITTQPEIKSLKADVQDSMALVTFRAKNIIVADSLENQGAVGEKEGIVRLVRQKGKWKVDGLEW